MVRLHDAEVAVIECRDTGGFEAFSDRDDAGVAAAEWEVTLAVNEFTDSFPVGDCERFDAQGLVDDRLVQADLAVGADLPVDDVCGFSDDHRGRDEWPASVSRSSRQAW